MPSELLENGVEVRYRGPATLPGSGAANLHGRADGASGMLWDALVAAGWVGELTSPRMTVAIRVGVPCAPTSNLGVAAASAKRRHEGGWTDSDGVSWQQVVGPLSGRAAGPGFRLREGELTPGERERGDALLRAAAIDAGWLDGEVAKTVELPDVQITVSVAKRNPRWEDPDSHAPALDQSDSSGTLGDDELLTVALEVAARFGDPNPVLVQHARGTRFDVTRVTGSTVFSDTPSCIFAMEGNFRWNHSRPASDKQITEQDISYRFLTVVIDATTGQPMDYGASNQPRDLTPLGNVITDRPPQQPPA